MDIYVLRHGTTNWNEKGISQGRSQNRLSKSGVELVKQRAKENKDLPVDIIYSSPLFRTIQTTNIFNKYHNAKVVKDKRLIEIDQGVFTGRKYTSLTDEEKILRFARSKSCGMESYKEVFNRVKDFIKNLLKNEKQEHVLIVAHDAVCTSIDYILTNTQPDFNDNKKMNMFNNAELRKYKV